MQDTNPCHGISPGGNVVSWTDFQSRNLGTGRPTIQCTAWGEYTHQRRECPYDNYYTTCNNHATHICRAPRQMAGVQQRFSICVYCDSADHSSAHCCNRPWENREQPHGTPDALRNQEKQWTDTKILGDDHGNAALPASNTQGWPGQSHLERYNTKISGNSRSHHSNNQSGSNFSRCNQNNYDRNTPVGFGTHSSRGNQQNQ